MFSFTSANRPQRPEPARAATDGTVVCLRHLHKEDITETNNSGVCDLRYLVALILILLAACSTAGGQAISSGERYAASGGAGEDYRLGVGDKVRVIVYKQDSLSGEFQVNSAGDLSLPLVGDIKALGETTSAISKTLHDRLADGYLRDPRVSMEVLTYRPYFILGEVKTPGQYPYATGLTVLNAIASAQGFTPRADTKAVWIRRSGTEDEKLYRLSPDLKILPGDTVRVSERLF